MRHFTTTVDIPSLKHTLLSHIHTLTLTPNQLNQIQAHIVKTPKPHYLLNTLLGSFAHSSTPHNALLLYNQMLHNPTSHNHFTFTIALKACSLLHSIPKGLEIHAHIFKSGNSSDIFIQNSLIHFYVVENRISSACRVFDAIAFPDVVSWTSIISGLSKCGFEEKAIDMFSSMDVKPNCSTLVSVLSACSSIKDVKFGKSVHGYALKQELNEGNEILDNAILDFYVKCGSLETARYLFVKIPKRDVFTWTIIVGGLSKRGFYEDAIRVFQEMVEIGEVEPNEATIVSVLTACSYLGALSLGRWVHSYLSARHDLAVAANVNLGNALMNMHSKCGDMVMAFKVFNMLTCKDVVSWGTIISGVAMNGLGEHALPLFSLMLVHGLYPDDVTFIGLLSACSHAGMVDQGYQFFKAMTDVYGIEPQMQHYACMVDMYGRAGLLEKAENFINEMPVEAEGPVWGALLNACRSYGNEEMLERITRCLSSTKGVSTGTYALLSNTYASSSKWDDAHKVRDEMRNMGLKKMAGCSLIEVDASNPEVT